MLTVPAFGDKRDSGDFLTNVYLTHFFLSCSQDKCSTREYKVNGNFPIQVPCFRLGSRTALVNHPLMLSDSSGPEQFNSADKISSYHGALVFNPK